jgi:predicted nuclease of restriction endonuclease-like (RecB) superfamily
MANKKSPPSGKKAVSTPAGYPAFLAELKDRIRAAQLRAAVAVNSELVLLYWRIGRDVLRRQTDEGWGAKVIDRLGKDLQSAFPGVAGFSPRNLKYMRAFAEAWPDEAIVQQAAAQIPWFHNCVLLDKVKDAAVRLWYVQQTVANGWSRSVLALQIESGLHARQGKAVTNFATALPDPQSDLARDVLKNPYNFDFLALAADHREADVEAGLLAHIRRFLLELGSGFAFVGQQMHLEVGDRDFYLDLLFYHLRLRCFVVIDLKAGEFEPEHAGKMNFYLSAVDDQMRHPDDRPSIGIILCRGHDRVIAEYALRDLSKPVGVSTYLTQIVSKLPAALRDELPDPTALAAAYESATTDE